MIIRPHLPRDTPNPRARALPAEPSPGSLQTIPRPNRGLCLFGSLQIAQKAEAVSREINGVRKAEDIEYIHRMRVASRRLRAAMGLFSSCFPEKKFRQWTGEIRRVTRALGMARDLDVQIAFLRKYRKKIVAGTLAIKGAAPDDIPLLLAGIDYLAQDLTKQRKKIQEDVIRLMDNLEQKNILAGMQSHLGELTGRAGQGRYHPRMFSVPVVAAENISKRLDRMLAFSPWVLHRDAVAEHHAMRIAAKKLRYTMEVYSGVYRRGLGKYTRTVAGFQEVLGNLHDADVWIDMTTRIILRERVRLRSRTSSGRPTTTQISGLRIFLRDREVEREKQYRKFVRYWRSEERKGTWEDLRRSLLRDIRIRYLSPVSDTDTQRGQAEAMGMRFPPAVPHETRVTTFALRIFDDTVPVHGMDEQCRHLLYCASMVHDTGKVDGKRGHASRSGAEVLADETLGLTIEDRCVISLVAGNHTRKKRPGSGPLFSLLTEDRRRVTLMLTTLLRIANSLDSRHAGTVEALHCNVLPDSVDCIILASKDPGPELADAAENSELFRDIFGIPIRFIPNREKEIYEHGPVFDKGHN